MFTTSCSVFPYRRMRLPRALRLYQAVAITTLVAGCAAAVGNPACADEKVYSKAVRSTVLVVTESGLGTGVVVLDRNGKKVVATANHVVAEASRVFCFFPTYDDDGELVTDRDFYQESPGERGVPVRVIIADQRRDLALLEPEAIPDNVPAIPLARRVAAGEQIHIVGNSPAAPLFGYLSGTVRGVFNTVARPEGRTFFGRAGRREDSSPIEGKYFTTDAPVNPGDSGGPVLRKTEHDEVELVGLVSSFTVDARLVSNIIHVSELAALIADPIRPQSEDREPRIPKLRERAQPFGFRQMSLPTAVKPFEVGATSGAAVREDSIVGNWRVLPSADNEDLRITFDNEGQCVLTRPEANPATVYGTYSLRDNGFSIKVGTRIVLTGRIRWSTDIRIQITLKDDSEMQLVRD